MLTSDPKTGEDIEWTEDPIHPMRELAGATKQITRGAKAGFPSFIKISGFLLLTLVIIVLAYSAVNGMVSFASDVRAGKVVHFGSDTTNNQAEATATPVPPYVIQATQTALAIDQASHLAAVTAQAVQNYTQATATAISQQATAVAINNAQVQEKERATRDQANAPFYDTLVKIVILLLIAAPVLAALYFALTHWTGQSHRRRLEILDTHARINTLNPDHNGNYPARITSTGLIRPAPGNILQPVPASFNYAPHLMFKDGPANHLQAAGAQTAGLLAAPTAAELELPTKLDLTALIKQLRPDSSCFEIILGQTKSGYIIRPYGEETLHFGFIGATGSGKSSEVQAVVMQLALADPTAQRIKFGFLDLEGKTSKPFANAPHTMFIADDPEQCAAALQELEAVMDSRARLSDIELESEIVYAIVLEEFLDLRDELDKESWNRVIRIARKGRKSKIYLICANQTFYSDDDTKIIKGQLRTRSLFAVEDRGTGNAFGYRDNVAIDELARAAIPGRFLFRSPTGLVLAQAPYISPAAITAHFARSSRAAKGQVIEAEYRPVEPTDSRQPQPTGRQTGYHFEAGRQTDKQPNYSFERDAQPGHTTDRQADPAPQGELAQVVELYRQGATSSRTMAAALSCGKDRANNLINQARAARLI